MEHIKYRAWDGKKLISWEELQSVAPIGIKSRGLVLQQYTGVADVDGNEIYKGDIVQTMQAYKKTGRKRGSPISEPYTVYVSSGLPPRVVDWTVDSKKVGFNICNTPNRYKIIGHIFI